MKKHLLLFSLMMLLTIAAIGQKTVNGTITDKFGETLIGVNMLLVHVLEVCNSSEVHWTYWARVAFIVAQTANPGGANSLNTSTDDGREIDNGRRSLRHCKLL